MDLHLSGKTVLITGGSKGIGYGIAERLAEEGCNVILVSRNAGDLDKARKQLEARFKVKVATLAADLSQLAGQEAVVAAHPDIDILVNNAGAIRRGQLEDVDDALWKSYWDLKVFGYINLTRSYYTRMKARREGVILNIIGVAGERLDAGYIAGSTGNAALIAFTRAMGGASPDFGIRVVGINPGSVMTEKSIISHRLQAQDKFGDPERWPELVKTKPFGRAIKPEEISAMAALLVSDLSGYTSGTVFTIDGGASNRRPI